MVYTWAPWAMGRLVGVEPGEVLSALSGDRPRRPRRGVADTGQAVLTIWARTRSGRPLLVMVHHVGGWDWEILGARQLSVAELVDFEEWEGKHDD